MTVKGMHESIIDTERLRSHVLEAIFDGSGRIPAAFELRMRASANHWRVLELGAGPPVRSCAGAGRGALSGLVRIVVGLVC